MDLFREWSQGEGESYFRLLSSRLLLMVAIIKPIILLNKKMNCY